jgi:hypothetical protein
MSATGVIDARVIGSVDAGIGGLRRELLLATKRATKHVLQFLGIRGGSKRN